MLAQADAFIVEDRTDALGLAWQILQTLPNPALIIDCESFVIEHANRAAEKLYEAASGSLCGVTVQTTVVDPSRAIDFLQQHRDHVPLRYHRTLSGKHIAVEIRVRYVDLNSREYAIMSVTDITERGREQQRQNEFEMRYHAIFDSAPYPILLVATGGQIVEANPAASALYRFHEANGGPVRIEEIIQSEEGLGSRLFTARPTYLRECRHYRADGSSFPAETTIAYVRLQGQVTAILVVRDVTEARHTLNLLEEAEQRWRFALESSNDAVWDWDLRSGHLYRSPSWTAVLGTNADLDEARHWLTEVHPDDHDWVQQRLQSVLGGAEALFEAEFRIQSSDGAYRWVVARGRIIERDRFHLPIRMLGTLRDVDVIHQQSERERQQQRELAHAVRLIMMGEMASVLAHEINQPLTAMTNFATLCLRLIDTIPAEQMSQRLREPLDMIRAQAMRAGEIVHRVKGFVRKGSQDEATIDINQLIRQMLAMLEFECHSYEIEVCLQLHDTLPMVRGDAIQIEQVILNLLKNGVEAMREQTDRRRMHVETRYTEDDVLIEVADSGCGLSPEMQDALFKPFNTTKADGLGLGLAICHSIIEAHGGHMGYRDNPEGGSIFWFELPIDKETRS